MKKRNLIFLILIIFVTFLIYDKKKNDIDPFENKNSSMIEVQTEESTVNKNKEVNEFIEGLISSDKFKDIDSEELKKIKEDLNKKLKDINISDIKNSYFTYENGKFNLELDFKNTSKKFKETISVSKEFFKSLKD